jgi:uncharacterized membrane protein YvbJ
MALITCPDCSAKVSDQAPACLQCGAPIAYAKDTAVTGVQLTTVQETSKRLKIHILISALLFWSGIILVFSEHFRFAGLPIFVGFIWYVITKTRIWWHHK